MSLKKLLLKQLAKKQDFIKFVQPSFKHMQKFNSHTLVRLLISFIPLADFLHKNRINPKTISSFGSGSCSHEIFLKDMFPKSTVNCFDLSAEYIPKYSRAKMNRTWGINFTEVALEEMNWSEYASTSDFVLSIQTLEHIEDHETALKNLAIVCKPNGYIYIDTPYYSELDGQETEEYLKKERKRQWDEHSHFHLGFSLPRMSKRLENLGFEIVDKGYSSYVKGETDFMNLIRTNDVFLKTKASRSYIHGIAGTVHTLLENFEKEPSLDANDVDSVVHKDRPVLAIRILARKCNPSAASGLFGNT